MEGVREHVKALKLGEQKEVGIEVKALNGGTFTITSATYVFKKADDTVLASGNATINDNNVFVLINATDKGSSQQVEFTVTITPSNIGKSVEVHKQVIEITVK